MTLKGTKLEEQEEQEKKKVVAISGSLPSPYGKRNYTDLTYTPLQLEALQMTFY